jgi:hypothetical protein
MLDLMHPRRKDLQLHENETEGVYIENLTEYEIKTAETAQQMIRTS